MSKIVIELSLDELERLSIACEDAMSATSDDDDYKHYDKLQRKLDKMVKAAKKEKRNA
jgi:hypothetical protein